MSEIEQLDAIQNRIVRQMLRSREWQLKLAAAVPAGVLLGARIGNETRGRIVNSIGFSALFVVFVSMWLWSSAGKPARGLLLAAWGRSHDLTFDEWPDLGNGTPLLREGDSREAENGLVGELLGLPLMICHFTYTFVGPGEEGGTQTAHSQLTVARISGVETPADGLTLHPITGFDRGLRKRRSGLPNGRVVELESMAMHHAYKLEAQADVSENVVRRIFEPSFMEWCVDERNVLFEIEVGELVVAVRDHISEPHELEDLWARARWVLKRVVAAAGSPTG